MKQKAQAELTSSPDPTRADEQNAPRSSGVSYCAHHPAQTLPCVECDFALVDVTNDPWADYFPHRLCRTVITTSTPAAHSPAGEGHGGVDAVDSRGEGTELAGGGATPHAPSPAGEVDDINFGPDDHDAEGV